MEMEQMTIYKKDVERWENGMLNSRHTYVTYLTGNKKGEKVNLSSMCDVKIEDLIGKKFFATIREVNGRKYITNCIIK